MTPRPPYLIRKVPSKNKLRSLPMEKQMELREFLRGNSLSAGVVFCKEKFDVDVNKSQVDHFRVWYDFDEQQQKNNIIISALLEKFVDKHGLEKSEEGLRRVGTLYLSALAVEQKDAKSFCQLQGLAIRSDELDVLREKIAHAEKAKEKLQDLVKDGGLTPETLTKAEAALKLL